MMKTKDRKKGISLIVLIITIIVVIILAAVVILTLSKNNPIESAKEARFKEEVRTFQDELALTVSKQYTAAGGHRDEKITTSDFDEIKEFIPSFSEKYRDKFIIQDDELRYTNKSENEKKWCNEISVKNKIYTELEYLESTGEQWIETDYYLKNYSQVDAKFSILSGNNNSIFGSRDSKNSYMLLQASRVNKKLHFYCGYKIDYWREINEPLYNKIYLSSSENGKIIIQDLGNINMNCNTFELTEPMYIFAFNESGVAAFISESTRLYYLKIIENNELIHEYIPVLDSNNKPALYDKIEGNFYYNQGTGEDFRAGPAVD